MHIALDLPSIAHRRLPNSSAAIATESPVYLDLESSPTFYVPSLLSISIWRHQCIPLHAPCVALAMASSASDGGTPRSWHVVYTLPSSKRKLDGILSLRFLTPVVKKIFLFDHSGSSLLADRFLNKFDHIVLGATLHFPSGFAVSVDAPLLAPPPSLCPSSASSPSSSIPPPSLSRPSSLTLPSPSPSLSHSFRLDPPPIANVGTRWNVLYTRHPNKKSKMTHEGVLRLAQKTQLHQKVVLCDNEGTQIEQQFLGGGEEITCGKTLQFENASVDVIDIKEDPPSPAEVRIIQDMPANQKRLHWQRPESSFQGMTTTECGERESLQVGHDRIGRIRSTSMAFIQPKRRDSRQILNSLKRPTDLAGTTNSCSLEQLEREGTFVLSSVSRRPFEEEGSATLDCVARIQKFNVDKACPEESADDCIHLEHDVPQQKNGLGDHRSSIVDNLDDRFGTSMEQNEIAAENFGSKASPHMKRGPSKCFGKGSIKPFKSPQNNGALIATHRLPSRSLSLDFQVDVPAILRREVTIPDKFNSLTSYQSIMSSAIIEELKFVLYDLAKRFGNAKNELSRLPGSRPSCRHGATQLGRQLKDGRNFSRLFYNCKSKACEFFSWADESGKLSGVTSSGDESEQRYDCFNLEFYSDCELCMRSKKTWDEPIGEDTAHQNAGVSENTSVLLKLGRVKRFAKYSRHDIWVISSNPNFCKIRSDDFLAVAVSKRYGASTEGILELELLGQNPRQQTGLFALHDRGVSTELKMLDVIRSLHPSRVPLLPLLLCSKQPVGPKIHQGTVGEGLTAGEEEDLKGIVRRHMNTMLSKFQLNSDQAKVLLTVSKWFLSNGSEGARVKLQHPELCLVHGTFGSGKSFLLVVLVIFIIDLLKIVKNTTSKILISAATNIAVDRILVGLLEHDFTDFIRVGSLGNISKSILPYSVYTITQSHGDKESVQELQQLIKRANASSKRVLEEELQNIKEGKMLKRREKLKTMRVVGVTCHSYTNPVLDGQNFTICILDECSQMPEPLSLLPLTGCAKLIAVGDPAQLPPTLSHAGADWGDELSSTTEINPLDDINTQSLNYGHDGEPRKLSSDLRRALFVRLAKVYEPILLRTQYRCHPRLTAVPNSLFYEEKLINGCREVDRPPLLQGLPPLLFCDTGRKGVEKKDGMGFKNEYEADLVSQIITYLISHGIPGLQIGVIVFYKSQAVLVQQTLRQNFPRDSATSSNTLKMFHENDAFVDVQVSTVDAFQGMEKNIILLCCCRTNGLGFLASSNRLNVALTRARHHLIIIGKAENLHNNSCWKELLSSVRSSPGSYMPAQEFVANLSANRRGGFYSNSHLGAVSVDRKNCIMQNEGASSRLSSQEKSSGFVDNCLCSEEVKNILDDVHFRVQDFWVGYKLYCFGHYSQCDLSKEQFLASKMGRVVFLLQKGEVVRWGAKFDETVRQAWVMMEEYIRIRYDKDCTNLRALMEEFEDEKELSTSENGSLLLQLVKDDEHGNEHLFKQAHNVQIRSTDIFDQIRSRLNRVDSNLGNLLKSSELNSGLDRASNSCESGSVDNAVNFSVDSRNKSKEWGERTQSSFSLGF